MQQYNSVFKNVTFYLEKRIQDVWMLHDVHYITTLLHPSMKNFHINPTLQKKALELVKKEIFNRQLTTPNNTSTTAATTSADTNALDTQSTTSKGLLSYCFDVPQSHLKSASTPYDELNEYMKLNVQLDEEDDILQFWLKQKSKFPILFTIVQDLYAVPASNTTVERLFSSSKNTITDKRTSLGAEKVNKLLFLQKNLELLKSFDDKNIGEVGTNDKKSTVVAQLSATTSNQHREQSIITKTTKKFKMDMVNEIDLVCFDEDDEEEKENDDIDFF
jgi:hypothetical protein